VNGSDDAAVFFREENRHAVRYANPDCGRGIVADHGICVWTRPWPRAIGRSDGDGGTVNLTHQQHILDGDAYLPRHG
jgi:hypothetical protein